MTDNSIAAAIDRITIMVKDIQADVTRIKAHLDRSIAADTRREMEAEDTKSRYGF